MASVMNAVAYGSDEVHQGPEASTASLSPGEPTKVIVDFLMNSGQVWDVHEGQNCSYARHGGEPRPIPEYYCKGFEVQGSDGVWSDAEFVDAELSGKLPMIGHVEINSPVESPVAIRYGWSDYPLVNLYNQEGFPAPPFQMQIS